MAVNDSTAPTKPGNVTVNNVSDSSVTVEWTPSEDPDSGILFYEIYRDDVLVGTAGRNSTSYTDIGLKESTEYSYSVSAVNGGVLRTSSEKIQAGTLKDTVPPAVLSAGADSKGTIKVTFSEPVDKASAENKSNITLSAGIIKSVILDSDLLTLKIETEGMNLTGTNVLTLKGITDLSSSKNKSGTIECSIRASVIASWNLNEGDGSTFYDSTGSNGEGTVKGDGIRWAVGTDGTPCLEFSNSVTSFAKINSSEMSLGNNFTITAEFKAKKDRSGTDTYMHTVIAKNSKTTGHFEVYISNDGMLHFYSPDMTTENGALGDFSSGKVVDNNEWHRIAITAGNGVITFYIDGEKTASQKFKGKIADCKAPVVIGNLVSESMFPFNGLIDNVVIYNMCLSPEQLG